MSAVQIDAEAIEADLLVDAIKRRWGYDFSHYSRFSLMRRLKKACADAGYARLSAAIEPLLYDQRFFDGFLRYMSITVTEMFRNPEYYLSVRENVLKTLRSFPFIKIWHAGCATGEEVYSMAIMLHEAGLLPRARIYATDFNKGALDVAKKGMYPADHMRRYADNYRRSGGARDINDYFSVESGCATVKAFVKKNVTFSYHNLAADGAFGEMHVISCRNVLIYFDKTLQGRVLTLFCESLRHGGFLCLGNKENVHSLSSKHMFEHMDKKQRIYKKCASPTDIFQEHGRAAAPLVRAGA
ncbi:MAG: protein-glutamate O-methyltransferase CheR [Rickettsiales bacterium]